MSIADHIEQGCRILNRHLLFRLNPEILGKLSSVRSANALLDLARKRGAKLPAIPAREIPAREIAAAGVQMAGRADFFADTPLRAIPSDVIVREGAKLIKKMHPKGIPSHAPGSRVIATVGAQLIASAKEDTAIGTALVGYASHITSTQLCMHCPNNAAPRSKYCDIHAATDKRTRAGYRAGKRALEYVARSKSRNLLTAWLRFRIKFNQDFHKHIERELVLYLQPPKNWRELVEIWVSQYPMLRNHGLQNEKSWEDVIKRLRVLLYDNHCISQNPNIWGIKLQAAEAESDLLEERRQLLYIKASELHEKICALAQQKKINQAEVARRLSVSGAAISKHVKQDSELRALFEKNRKNRSKSKRRKKGRSATS